MDTSVYTERDPNDNDDDDDDKEKNSGRLLNRRDYDNNCSLVTYFFLSFTI
jgi:hypothetical protein